MRTSRRAHDRRGNGDLMTNDLAIGVVGYGLRGSLAKYAHQPKQGSRVVALFDPSEAAQDRFRSDFGHDVKVHGSLDELNPSELDAVFVLSPDYLHEEQAITLLRAGVAVYLEKPMAITTEGCDRILQTARQHQGKLYLGHNMRHMTFVREMKRRIDAGDIGTPKVAWCRHFVGHGGDFYFADWHAERKYGTSLLLQKGAHDIDILHWLCGAYATEVSGIGDRLVYSPDQAGGDSTPWWQAEDRLTRWPPRALRGLNPAMDVEDTSMINMRLANGVLASYQQCHFTPDYWRNYTIIGTEGRIENFGNGGPGTVIRLWNRRHGYHAEGDVSIPLEAETGPHGEADARIVAEFLQYVREGGRTETSPVAARYAVAAGCAGAESIRSGGAPVRVPPVDPKDAEYFG